MELVALINEIKELETEWRKHLPMAANQQQALDKKFRLEFNYNSNHIEGNTLTYGETAQLIIFGETSGNHTIREYEEMQAGDVALKLVQELASEKERPLTEAFIKNLNETLLVKPYWKDAITTDGQNTRRQISIGAYKKHPNSVILQNGELFHYASPEETPAMMGDLIDWYRAEEEKQELHPVALAALLHYRFVRIHPFDDGNGRISRLLMNYVLYYHDLPPVVIKSADKKNYLRALNEADAGSIDAFVAYIAQQLAWSLQLSIKAAKGESVEEQNDWEKQLSVLKKNLIDKEGVSVTKTRDAIISILNNGVFPLVGKLIETLSNFDDLFSNKSHGFNILFNNVDNPLVTMDINATIDYILQRVKSGGLKSFHFSYRLQGFKKNGTDAFNCTITIEWFFSNYKYYFAMNDIRSEQYPKLYNQFYSKDEIDKISSECGKLILAEIERHLNKNK